MAKRDVKNNPDTEPKKEIGRPRLINSPEELWELFVKYKVHCKANPIKKHVFVGKEGFSREEKRERPLTMEGFENYVAEIPGKPTELTQYFGNKNGSYQDYFSICSRIRRVIRQDQIDGGMAQIYNTSITQRLNNLKEVTENHVRMGKDLEEEERYE